MRAALVMILVFASACGEESASTLDRKAFAALAKGDLVQAEIAADRAAARGGPDFEARRDFLMGNAAFARCAKDEMAMMGPRGSAAVAAAIRHAEEARAWWQRAAARQADWPAARRNVERALLKIEELEKKKAELEPLSRPVPKPPPPGDRPQHTQPQLVPGMRVDPQLTELPADQVSGILDRLKKKEEDKLRVRRERQASASLSVEKDW